MSVRMKSIVFLALAFAVSWAIAIGGHFAGLPANLAAAVLFLMMTGPAIAALVCAIAFEKGRRIKALGLGGRWTWWWAAAWLIPIALAITSVLATVLLSDRSYVDLGEAVRAMAEAQGQDASEAPPLLLSTPFILAMSAVVGAAINWPLLTITEELGWRGYLHDLWRPFGFWRAALGTGFVWGVWHAPAIFFYGLNYPDDKLFGIGLFTAYCMLLSPLLTLVRDRTNSVWAAGLFHGAINAVGGLTLLALSSQSFPWNGIVGIGGFIALALGVALIAAFYRPAPR